MIYIYTSLRLFTRCSRLGILCYLAIQNIRKVIYEPNLHFSVSFDRYRNLQRRKDQHPNILKPICHCARLLIKESNIKFQFSQVAGIIFDLDDTLVKTTLDFAAIRRDIACPSELDILTFIDNLPCLEQQREAKRIVIEHELHDAHSSTWLPGAKAFVERAKRMELPLAIVTRNCREATKIKLSKNSIAIEHVITREDAPPKPDPTALINIAQTWQIEPRNIAYLGDYIYDIQAAHNADMQAWLYKNQSGIQDYGDCLSYVPKI